MLKKNYSTKKPTESAGFLVGLPGFPACLTQSGREPGQTEPKYDIVKCRKFFCWVTRIPCLLDTVRQGTLTNRTKI